MVTRTAHIVGSTVRKGILTLLAGSLAFTAAGCGIGAGAAPSADPFSSAVVMQGVVHGGQIPLAFATVSLYAAGTTGYGSSAGTPLATTTSAATTGNFSFTKGGTGSGGWSCPVTVPASDPQIYYLVTGGNTTGATSGSPANENGNVTLLAVLGPCSTITNSTFTYVDELSTVAAATALAQYINPGTTAGTESIGTNGANLVSNPSQAAIGLNNAVASIANLSATSTTHTGTAATVSSVTVTATPNYTKLLTMANILAACVNNTTTGSANCTQLFAAATPPSPAVTSQPGATFGTAVDTLQAAYYMATNPTDSGTVSSPCSPTYTSNIACLYALSTATGAAFTGGLGSQPLDWTVGVTYTASGACQNGAVFLIGPTHAAVDASGNVWIINANSVAGSKAAFVELSPVGQPMACYTGTGTSAPQTYGSSITIDPTGNVWALYSHNSPTGLIQEVTATGTQVAWTPPNASPSNPLGLTADGNGNIFFTSALSGGTLYEIPNPGTTTTPFTPITVLTSMDGTGTNTMNSLAVDALGRIWAETSSFTSIFGAYPTGTPATASITGYSVASNVVTFTATNSFSVGQAITITGLTSGSQFNNQTLTLTAASSSSFSAAFTTANVTQTSDAGTASAQQAYTNTTTATSTTGFGIAVGSGNYVYSGTTCCGSSAAHEAEKFTPAATAVAGSGSSSAQFVGGLVGARAEAVDGAQNVWTTNEFPETGTTTSAGVFGVTELTETGSGTHVTFTGLSPAGTLPATCTTAAGCPAGGGFQDSNLLEASDVEIDPSGNVWVLNTGTTSSGGTFTATGTSVTEFVGAAVPIVTPLSLAAKNGTIATKP